MRVRRRARLPRGECVGPASRAATWSYRWGPPRGTGWAEGHGGTLRTERGPWALNVNVYRSLVKQCNQCKATVQNMSVSGRLPG